MLKAFAGLPDHVELVHRRGAREVLLAQFPWQQHGHSVDELPVGGNVHEVTVAVHLPCRREEPADGRFRLDD